jgi:hypothetical protein
MRPDRISARMLASVILPDMFKRIAFGLSVCVVWVLSYGIAGTHGQNATTSSAAPARSAKENAEFSAAADEVLQQMSEITGLKLRSPLKKTLRSREEIRAYVIREMDEDKNAAERYAGARSAEAFGLLPKNFDFDNFMVALLTEQIAGLYDPRAHEFYIADWIPLSDQRMVMAHELTHALEDQHFNLEPWVKMARPNDDAELAREAVLEGSAMAAMIDYLLQGTGRSIKDMPDIDPSMFLGDLGSTPTLAKAPPFIKDVLIFPYLSGLQFSITALKDRGWPALPELFEKPPASTQQILHPATYQAQKAPQPVSLPSIEKILGSDWSKLEENVLGEFGWREVLKQFLGQERAQPLATAWAGDRYLVYENKANKHLVLLAGLRLAGEDQAARFFGQYSEALEKKHAERTNLFRRANFFSFDTPDGGVFLRCVGADCVTAEGTNRAVFEAVNKAMNWPALPVPAADLNKPAEKTARMQMHDSAAVEVAYCTR